MNPYLPIGATQHCPNCHMETYPTNNCQRSRRGKCRFCKDNGGSIFDCAIDCNYKGGKIMAKRHLEVNGSLLDTKRAKSDIHKLYGVLEQLEAKYGAPWVRGALRDLYFSYAK